MVIGEEVTPASAGRKIIWDEDNLAMNDLIKAELNTNPQVRSLIQLDS